MRGSFGADHPLDRLVTSLEFHRPSCGVASDAFIPGDAGNRDILRINSFVRIPTAICHRFWFRA